MSDKEKKELENAKIADDDELDLDDLEQVSGGSLKDVYFTKTKKIDESIQERI